MKSATFALAFGKQASFRQAGRALPRQTGAPTRRPVGRAPKKKSKKKLPKNLERNKKRITFAKFFRLTKSVGRRGPAKRDGNPRGH